MSTRLHITMPDDLVDRIDLARGDVQRAAWIRRAVERALDQPDEFRTKTGRILTDADFEALADEAERGYDVSHMRRVPARRDVEPFPRGG